MTMVRWPRSCGYDFVFIALVCVNSFTYAIHASANEKETTAAPVGYVAEWEYIDEHLPWPSRSESPSNRLDPALWQDSSTGAWWLFGGRRAEHPEPLADLWVYKPDSDATYAWHPVFHPDAAISSSFPDPSINPILCGSNELNTIAVFGPPAADAAVESNSLFDDNLVWIYKIPSSKSKADAASTGTGVGDEGIWTSYMCCDVCDPATPVTDAAGTSINEKTNKTTNLEFCPHFSKSSVSKGDGLGQQSIRRSGQSKVEQELEEKVNTESGIKVEPILWCAADSLMALQLTFAKSQNSVSHAGLKQGTPSPETQASFSNKGSEKVSKELRESYPAEEIESATFPSTRSTKIHLSDHNRVSPPAGPPHSTAYNGLEERVQLINEFPTTTTTTRTITNSQRAFQQSKIGLAAAQSQSTAGEISSKDKNKSGQSIPNYLNWWKFNLGTSEWEILPQVIMGADPDLIYKLFDPSTCRTTSDSIYVYIFCIPEPIGANSAARDVYLFNPATSRIDRLAATLQLNTIFAEDPRMWTREYSTLHAIRVHELSQTVIMIAYGKLIDFWIHDHKTNSVRAVENVWKGAALDRFQHHDAFYKLRLSILNCTREHNVFLPNPRHMTAATAEGHHHELIFNDTSSPSAAVSSSGWFHIQLETDENIFLPSRDASFMINVGREEEDGNGMEQQTQSSTIENPITAAGANTTTAATVTVISPLPRNITGTSFSKIEVDAPAAAAAVAVLAEQFPNEKEKIQFNSHSKLQVEEPRAMPVLSSSSLLQNHDDAVIGKFNLNNSPASSSSLSSSSSLLNLTPSDANGKRETSSEGTGTTFLKFNNVVLSSLSQQQQQPSRFQSVTLGNLNARKKTSSIFNDWTNGGPQIKDPGPENGQTQQQSINQSAATLIMSKELLEPQINNASVVNITTNPESSEQVPEVEISVRQNVDDGPSPFSPSLELKLASFVDESKLSVAADNAAVIDNNYSKSESVVEDNESASAVDPPISDDYTTNTDAAADVDARSLWQVASSSGSDPAPSSSWSYSSILFYSLSFTIFGAAALFLFLKRCVKCSASSSTSAKKSDEHVLFSECESRKSAGAGTQQLNVRSLPDDFYLTSPIV